MIMQTQSLATRWEHNHIFEDQLNCLAKKLEQILVTHEVRYGSDIGPFDYYAEYEKRAQLASKDPEQWSRQSCRVLRDLASGKTVCGDQVTEMLTFLKLQQEILREYTEGMR
jgi:hypothetical protein